jgi:hypothetical protein
MPDHNAALDRVPGAASLARGKKVALTSARGTRPEHCHGRCPRLPDLFALAKTVAKSVSAAMTRRASAPWTIWLAKSRNSKPNMRAPRARRCGTDNARSCLDLDSIYEYGPGLDRPDEARLLQAITTTSEPRSRELREIRSVPIPDRQTLN